LETTQEPENEKHGAPRAVAWGIFAALGVAYAALARFALDAYPASGDEASYLLQAKIFALGRLSVPAPAHAALFDVDHVVMDTIVRSKYSPGWPALLSLGVRAGAPWIVNPILGVLTLAVLFEIAKRFASPRASLAATLLIGCSPFYALNAASYHSHPSALLTLAIAAYAVARGAKDHRLAWAACAGLAVGATYLIRPGDAMLFAFAMIAFYRKPLFVVACGAGAAVVAALSLPYQAAQFGSPLRSGYAAYDQKLRALYGDATATAVSLGHWADPRCWWDHVKWFVELGAWITPGIAALAIVGFYATRRASPGATPELRRLLIVLAAAIVFLVSLMSVGYGDGYGPRYLFPLFIPGVAFGAAGIAWLVERQRAMANVSPRAPAIVVLVLVVCALLRLGDFSERSREEIDRREALYHQVADAKIHRAVVIVVAEFPTRWTRNDPTFDADVLYVQKDTLREEEVAALFPDRAAYVAARPSATTEWTITKLNDARGR
jgi:hypothetical protein